MSTPVEPPWTVINTPCRPSQYKVVQQGRHGPNGESRNNSWTEYFVHEHDAHKEAAARNRIWPVITECLAECMRQATANYEDLLLRWCATQRDYPTFYVPEPPMPPGLDLRLLRDRTITEFNRTI